MRLPKLTGTLVRLGGGRDGRMRVVPITRQPRLADGGCKSLRVVYAVEAAAIRSVACGPALRPRTPPPAGTSGPADD